MYLTYNFNMTATNQLDRPTREELLKKSIHVTSEELDEYARRMGMPHGDTETRSEVMKALNAIVYKSDET